MAAIEDFLGPNDLKVADDPTETSSASASRAPGDRSAGAEELLSSARAECIAAGGSHTAAEGRVLDQQGNNGAADVPADVCEGSKCRQLAIQGG